MNISIFGLGYVGAVTAGCLTSFGHTVIGVDVQEKKVASFCTGKSPIVEPELDELLSLAVANHKLLGMTSVKDAIAASEVSIICVGTPSLENGRLNLNYVRQVSAELAAAIHDKNAAHTLIFRSTMLPGSLRYIAKEFFSELLENQVVEILYCPEFLREGTAVKDFLAPSLSVLGTIDGYLSRRENVAGLLGDDLSLLNWEGAELIKYTCNYFHAVKVAFANEIGRVGKAVGVDSRKVMEVVCKDTRLNISSYYMKPGNPFGGSCLPKDVSALAAFARQEGVNLPMLNNVIPSNQAHLDALLKQIHDINANSVAIIGLSFKNNTDDLRGSPMVAVAETLLGMGKSLRVYDPHLSMTEMIGANEQVISRTMPHLADLLTTTATEAIIGSELVIVSQKCASLDELVASITARQTVIDVNDWPELRETNGNYVGSCW